MRELTGINRSSKDPAVLCENEVDDRLNSYYSRFDNKDCTREQKTSKDSIMKQKSPVVRSELSYVNKSTNVIRLMHISDPVTKI